MSKNKKETEQIENEILEAEGLEPEVSEDAPQACEQTEGEKELEQTKQTLLRTAAEYDNFRKRTAKEKELAFGNGVAHATQKLLSILDTLDLAANAQSKDEEYKKGVVMTLGKATEVFADLGITEIDAQDKPFDPETMSAVMQKPAEEGQKAGDVVQVFQKGYKLGERVVRHATVVVATE